MKQLIIILFVFSFFSVKSQGCLMMDVSILVDYSASMYKREANLKLALSAFVDRFHIDEDYVRIGIKFFSDRVTDSIPLTGNKNKLIAFLNKHYYDAASGSTDITHALAGILNENSTNNRNVLQVVLLISDGDPDSIFLSDEKQNGLMIAEQLKLVNNMVCSIYLKSLANYSGMAGGNYSKSSQDDAKKFMLIISSNGCYNESSHESLIENLKKFDFCI